MKIINLLMSLPCWRWWSSKKCVNCEIFCWSWTHPWEKTKMPFRFPKKNSTRQHTEVFDTWKTIFCLLFTLPETEMNSFTCFNIAENWELERMFRCVGEESAESLTVCRALVFCVLCVQSSKSPLDFFPFHPAPATLCCYIFSYFSTTQQHNNGKWKFSKAEFILVSVQQLSTEMA